MSGYPGIRAESATQICESDSLEKKIILATEGFMTKFSVEGQATDLEEAVTNGGIKTAGLS